jgi:hypothetical protein
MKSFKEYLTESKQTYDFKVKIAGDCPKDCAKKIKEALSMYKVESCSAGKSMPIAETYVDFPTQRNIGITVFDVCLAYPSTTDQVRSALGGALGVPVTNVKVRNMREEAEFDLNHANDGKSGESLLNKDHEVSSEAQDLVGDKHTMSLLKELGKRKKTTEQYTGVNDAILAKKSPSEKSAKANTTINTKSPVGSRTVKVPTAKTVGEKQ